MTEQQQRHKIPSPQPLVLGTISVRDRLSLGTLRHRSEGKEIGDGRSCTPSWMSYSGSSLHPKLWCLNCQIFWKVSFSKITGDFVPYAG